VLLMGADLAVPALNAELVLDGPHEQLAAARHALIPVSFAFAAVIEIGLDPLVLEVTM